MKRPLSPGLWEMWPGQQIQASERGHRGLGRVWGPRGRTLRPRRQPGTSGAVTLPDGSQDTAVLGG